MVQKSLRATPDSVVALLFVLAWAGILVLRSIPIGGSWDAIDPDALTLVTLWIGSAVILMLAGGWVARSTEGARQPGTWSAFRDSSRAINIGLVALSVAAMVGATLISFEFAVIRGYGFSTPVSMIRVLEVNRYLSGSTSSFVSGPGRLLVPAIMPAIVLAIGYWRRLTYSTILIFSLACCAVLLEQAMFEGGRLFIGATFIVTAVTFFSGLFRPDGVTLTRKITTMVSVLVIFGLVMVVYFGWIFVSRYEGSGEDMTVSYQRFSEKVMQDTAPPLGDVSIRDAEIATSANHVMREGMVPSEDPILRDIPDATGLAANPTIKFFWLYATHGLDQLGLVINFDFSKHAYGFFTFPQIAQILDKLLSTSLAVNYFSDLPAVGLYTTLIGSLYVDFGYAGSLVFAGIFGFLVGSTAQASFARREPTLAMLAFPLLVAVAAFSPMVSIVNHMWPALAWALAAGLLMHWDKRAAPETP